MARSGAFGRADQARRSGRARCSLNQLSSSRTQGQFVIRDFTFAFQFVQCRDDAVQLIGLRIFLAGDKLASRSRVLCTESSVVFSPGHHHRLGQIPGFASRYHVTRLVYFEKNQWEIGLSTRAPD